MLTLSHEHCEFVNFQFQLGVIFMKHVMKLSDKQTGNRS